MRTPLPIAVTLCLIAQVRPVSLQAQAVHALRLATRDAIQRAAQTASSLNQKQWARIKDLEGEDIVVTLYGGSPATRRLVRGTLDDAGFTALDLTAPGIPPEVKEELADAAWGRPEYFDSSVRPPVVTVNQRMRIVDGAVWLDGQRVVELDRVVQKFSKNTIAEISLVERAIRRGVKWGALVGAAVGVVVVTASCGTHWTRETETCTNLSFTTPMFTTGIGIGVGSVLGAGTRVTTVIYRGSGL